MNIGASGSGKLVVWIEKVGSGRWAGSAPLTGEGCGLQSLGVGPAPLVRHGEAKGVLARCIWVVRSWKQDQ